MKINELIASFTIQMTNEEKVIYDRLSSPTPLSAFPEREKFVIENLIRKSLVSKINNNNLVLVVKND